MDPELEAYDWAWKTTPKDRRNALCQALADQYVTDHPEVVAEFAGLTIPECVALLDVARAAGNEERRILIDVWIMAGFEFQQIGGAISTDGTARPPNLANTDGTPRAIGA